QIACMRVPLRTIADNRYFLALDDRQITIFVVINLHLFPLSFFQTLPERQVELTQTRTCYRLKTFSPRAIPETPVRTTSRMQPSPMARMNASSLSLLPVT